MRKLLTGLAVLAILGVCMPSYGAINKVHYVLVYKVSMKAAQTIFDVNDTNSLLSGPAAGYLAVDINEPNHEVIDANAVFYNTKDKEYKVIPDGVSISPHDPCKAELLYFGVTDMEGSLYTDVVGIGKPTKIYDTNKADPNTLVKKYVPTTMKGSSTLYEFDIVSPDSTVTGTAATSLTLDVNKTKTYNSGGNNVNQAINDIVTDLTQKGGWTKKPFIPD